MKEVAVILAALVVAACSSQTIRETDRTKSAEVNAELGLRYMLQGNNELALEKFQRALDFDPDSPAAHHYLAELYRRLKHPDEAKQHYLEAIDNAPDQSAVRNNYGVFLCQQREYAEAEAQFLKVLDNPVYRKKDETYENLGLCLKTKSDIDKAENYLRKALATNPKLPKSLFAMAELSFEKRQLLSARAYLQRYQEVAPHTPRTLWLGIRVERLLGDRNTVARYGVLLTRNFPESNEAQQYRDSERE